MAKNYRLKKLYLKAVAITESALNPRAYRYEPAFWERYLKDNPEWKDRNPNEVSASYGLMQLMFTTAHALGFDGSGEDLYNPVYNIELGAKLLRQLLDKVEADHLDISSQRHPCAIASARYNGGSRGNPGPDGTLRNQEYVDKVFRTWKRLTTEEKECDQT